MGSRLPLCLAPLLLMVGCDVADTPPSHQAQPIGAPPPAADDAVFFETVIAIAADGSLQETSRPITAAEERRQNAQRSFGGPAGAHAVHTQRDPGCAITSLWLYDRTDLTGNRICFDGLAGHAELSLGGFTRVWVRVFGYRMPVANWEIATGSYWPGADAGDLCWASPGIGVDASLGQPQEPVPCLRFDAYGSAQAFDLSPELARIVAL